MSRAESRKQEGGITRVNRTGSGLSGRLCPRRLAGLWESATDATKMSAAVVHPTKQGWGLKGLGKHNMWRTTVSELIQPEKSTQANSVYIETWYLYFRQISISVRWTHTLALQQPKTGLLKSAKHVSMATLLTSPHETSSGASHELLLPWQLFINKKATVPHMSSNFGCYVYVIKMTTQ